MQEVLEGNGARGLLAKLWKFCLVGASGVAVNLAVYSLCLWAGFFYVAAAVCAFLAAVSNNFWWNFAWTFRGMGRGKTLRQKYLEFFGVSLGGLGLNLLLLHQLVSVWGLDKTLAQLAAIGGVSFFNFFLNYTLTFREKKELPAS